MSDNSLYIQVKRRNHTFCLLCSKNDTILNVKRKLEDAVLQHVEKDGIGSESMRLILENNILQDSSSLESLDVKNDAAMNLVFEVANGEYETVDVVNSQIDDNL